MDNTQKITTFLWFNDNAEEAMNHYVAIFKDSKIVSVLRNGEAGPGAPGTVLVGTFRIEGQEFNALNGGPQFKFTEAISLVVNCDTQKELDAYWDTLCADGGKPVQCGWLKDKYGLSWQIVPSILPKLTQDARKSARVMQALMQMVKLDIKTLQAAYDEK